jgi:hypothetical protein
MIVLVSMTRELFDERTVYNATHRQKMIGMFAIIADVD